MMKNLPLGYNLNWKVCIWSSHWQVKYIWSIACILLEYQKLHFYTITLMKFIKIIRGMKNKVKIDDEEQALVLSCSLPHSFEYFSWRCQSTFEF